MARMTSTPAGTTRMSKERVDFAEARAYGIRGPAWDDGKLYYFLEMQDISGDAKRTWTLRLLPEEMQSILQGFINIKNIDAVENARVQNIPLKP